MRRNQKNKKWLYMIVVLLCSLGLARADTAWLEKQKLLPSDGAANERFGFSVSTSGDYAILGTPFDNDKGIRSGSAYIFKRDGDKWSQQAKIMAADGKINDQFGTSVSICGDFAIVGAFHDSNMTGSAYIFKRDGTKWVQQAKLLASDGKADQWFGLTVSIYNDYVIVGAPYDGDKGISSGSAYIFKRDGDKWSQQAKIVAADGAAYDQFSYGYYTVSIWEDLAIVGAPNNNTKGHCSGSAYVFKRDGTKWTQQAKLLASDGKADQWFGCSVSLNGDSAIIGAYHDDNHGFRAGSAYIFKWDGKSWNQQQKIIPADVDTGDWFGYSVSLNGDLASVGAPHLFFAGAVYVFRWDGKNWNQQAKLIPSDGAPTDLFGWSAAVGKDLLVAGSFADDDNGEDSGSAYIYKCEQTPKEQSSKEQAPKEKMPKKD